MNASRKASSSLALAMATAASPLAYADNVDVPGFIAANVKARAPAIYQQKLGRPMPLGTNVTVAFPGGAAQAGIEFTTPAAMPQRSLVLLQSMLSNCDGTRPTQSILFDKQTTQTESWRPLDTISSATPVKATLGSPPNAGFEPPSAPYVRDWNQGGDSAQPLAWNARSDVQVANGRKVTVQFVVDELTVETPFKATFAAVGKVALTFDRASVAPPRMSWSRQRPAYPLPAAMSLQDGFVCRVWPRDTGMYAGDVRGGLCVYVQGGQQREARIFEWLDADWMTLHRDCHREPTGMPAVFGPAPTREVCGPDYPVWNGFEWIAGAGPNVVRTSGPVVGGITYYPICRATTPGADRRWLVGWLDGDLCHIAADGREYPRDRFETLNMRQGAGEHTVVEVNVEDLLPTAERTFVVRGNYKGVTTIQGDFRVGTPRAPTCEPAPAGPAAGKASIAAGDAAPGKPEAPLPASASISRAAKPKAPGS